MSTYYAGEKRQDQPCGRVAEGVMMKIMDYTDETDLWSSIRVIRSKNAKKTYIVLKFYVFLQYKPIKCKAICHKQPRCQFDLTVI